MQSRYPEDEYLGTIQGRPVFVGPAIDRTEIWIAWDQGVPITAAKWLSTDGQWIGFGDDGYDDNFLTREHCLSVVLPLLDQQLPETPEYDAYDMEDV